jgi:hypothetical protein
MRRSPRTIAWGLLGIGLLAGCSTPGSAQPQPTVTSSPPTSSGFTLPPRPRTIKIDGKDPCGLIPQSDATKFQFDGTQQREVDPTFHLPDCFYGTNFGDGVILLDNRDGIDFWLTNKFSADVKWTTPVLGFAALTTTIPLDPEHCDVLVDVAPHESLTATVGIDPSKQPGLPTPCDFAHQWAETAISTLLNGN